MSVNYYYGAYAASPELSDYPVRLREAVALITAHTPATVDTVVSNTDSAYDVILHIGLDRFARLGIALGSGSATATVSIGKKDSGSYVATYSGTVTINTQTSAPWRCTLITVNGGDAWELRFAPTASQSFVMRFVKIKSSIDDLIHWTGYEVTQASAAETFPSSNPTDWFLLNGVEYAIKIVNYSRGLYGRDNVPSGTMLMFPAALYVEQMNELGLPTVGNQIPYTMSARETLGISSYDEFRVGRQLFVSIGKLAVRSL